MARDTSPSRDGQGRCVYTKLGQTILYEKTNSGVVKAYKHGRKTLVDLDSIDAMHARELVPWKPPLQRERG
jgi:hypothetical protein